MHFLDFLTREVWTGDLHLHHSLRRSKHGLFYYFCIRVWYIRRKVSWGTSCLIRFMAPMPETTFFVTFLMWPLQSSLSSMTVLNIFQIWCMRAFNISGIKSFTDCIIVCRFCAECLQFTLFYVVKKFEKLPKLEISERCVLGVRMEISGSLERMRLANLIQGFRILHRWKTGEKTCMLFARWRAGFGQHFQDLGHSFSLHRLTLRWEIPYLNLFIFSSLAKLVIMKIGKSRPR